MNSIPNSEFKNRIKILQQKMEDKSIDIIITYGNEAEPQHVRYFADFWPSFESAGVFIPVKGEPILLIGPESQTYAEDRSKIKRIEKILVLRESSEPNYPNMILTELGNLFNEFIKIGSNKRIGIVGYSIMSAPFYSAIMNEAKKANLEVVRAEELVTDN